MVLRGENMIITNNIAKSNLKEYSNKNNKISREIKSGKLFKIVTGLYETNPNIPGYLLASSIYGPSYISFEYALSFYGLIPERVSTITCASFDKKKSKQYNTNFGIFTYRDIPKDAYPEEIILKTEDNYSYQIASSSNSQSPPRFPHHAPRSSPPALEPSAPPAPPDAPRAAPKSPRFLPYLAAYKS